jgi:flagellar biosynthesis/type III secretory pathway protein FliH
MKEYQKFVFQDFPKSAVVHTAESSDSNEQDQAIADVVIEHLENVTKPAEEDKVEESPIDLTQVRAESYSLGYNDAKMELEPLIEKLKTEFRISELLEDKISKINPKPNLEEEVLNCVIDIIKGIATKLYLLLPRNFEGIIKNEVLDLVKRVHKSGKITIRVHKDQFEYCSNIINSFSEEYKAYDNIDIVIDEDLGNNDCIVDFDDTRIEYSQERIATEIDNIVTKLIKETSN